MNPYILTPQGKLFYQIESDSVSILSYEGTDRLLSIPEVIANFPVTRIAAKAFLGRRQIERLTLPDRLTAIGDWAFAHMTGLTAISLPPLQISLGRQVFLDCPALTQIHVKNQSAADPFLPSYLAASILIFKNPQLFSPVSAGNEDWYADFDRALCRFLEHPDDEGFEPVYLGWFEDEDVMATQYPRYIRQKRLEKAALTMKRLRSPNAMHKDFAKIYENYLISHFYPEVWECFCSEAFICDCSFLKLLLQLGCVTEQNIDALLADINRIGACEAAAMLLQFQQTALDKPDFFASLTAF